MPGTSPAIVVHVPGILQDAWHVYRRFSDQKIMTQCVMINITHLIMAVKLSSPRTACTTETAI